MWLTNKNSSLETCRRQAMEDCWFGNAQNGVGNENNDYLYFNCITLVKMFYISRFAESQTRPKSFIKLPHRSEG